MAYPNNGEELLAIAVSASRVASSFMRFYGDWFTRPKFLEGKLKLLPWPKMSSVFRTKLTDFVQNEYESRRKSYQGHEPFFDFVAPVDAKRSKGKDVSIDWRSLLTDDLESSIETCFGLCKSEAQDLYRELDEALAARSFVPDTDDDEASDEEEEFVLDLSDRSRAEGNLSYVLGCTFGRWDVRFANGEKPFPTFSDPFASLTVSPPGMLKNDDGLPVTSEDVQLLVERGQWNYPIEIPWNGILVDNPGDPLDIEARVHHSGRTAWPGSSWDSIERHACEHLGYKSLRDYFKKPSGFFADHLKRYTKSRRKAPIYWPLSSTSGGYTLWIYYPRLTGQTLYTVINDLVEPTLKQVGDDVKALRNKGIDRTRDEEKGLEFAQSLELELIELRDTLLKLAPTYMPNHNDGVQISAAPLWPLFRYKPWQKTLKETWAKLEKGDYDWAQLALNYWPERVREKCKTDKSLAIAHGLEDLYIAPEAQPKKARGKKKAEVAE